MTSVKIGIQTRSLRQPLKQAFTTAARLGADGVEIDARNELPPAQMSATGLREFRKRLDDMNLRVSAVAFPTRRGYDVTDELDRRIMATQAAMRFAYELGCQVVVNRIGPVPQQVDDPRFRQLVESLTLLGTYGQRIGVRFAAQSSGVAPEQLEKLIAALPEESIGVDLHAAGLIAGGHSPREAVTMLGRYCVHVHANDAVRDGAAGRTIEVALGRGMADFPSLLGQLAEFDYRGWVTIERHESASPIEEIGDAVAYLRAI